MHRIPLQLAEPSITWDRSQPEYILFDRTLNECNVEETDNFLTILDKETEDYCKVSYKLAVDQLIQVRELINSKHCASIIEGMRVLNVIVLRAPRDSPILAAALKLRGNYYFQQCCFEYASNDFEMCLFVHSEPNVYEELCEINGNLSICFYIMRQYENTKKYLRAYKKYKAKLSQEGLRLHHIAKIDNHIAQFKDELHNQEDLVPKFSDNIYFSIPFKGFNTSDDIPLSSAACYYISSANSKVDKSCGVYTNSNIPNRSVVLVEHPILQSINTPFVQCELCFRQREQVYTCLDCRYKTYCSLRCMEKDKTSHYNECIGYKYLTLLVLDASCLYCVFMRISILLHERIFTLKIFRKLTTAAAVWEKLQTIINEKEISGIQYLKLLTKNPDYKKLSDMQYATLVATAFRLTIFIEKKTLAIESFYKKLQISNKQKMIIVGAILMRLNCHLLNNTFDFEYNYPLYVIKPKYESIQEQVQSMSGVVKPVREGVVQDIDTHYNIDVQTDILEHSNELLQLQPTVMPKLDHSQSCNRIQRILSTYKDNIAELYFNPDSVDFFLYSESAGVSTTKISAVMICSRIEEMSSLERYQFVQKFARLFHMHFADYFLQMNLRHKRIQQIVSLLCPTLSKFRHSCDPNVEVVVLENGVVMGKTLREIKQGEELLVSYKANYMRHTRVERKMFLRRLNIVCHCKYCVMPEIEEPTNVRLGIYCEHCTTVELTPVHGKCPQCRANYNNLLKKYRIEMQIFEDDLLRNLKQKNVNDRQIYLSHVMQYLHAHTFLSSCNKFRINAELKHAKFLALKNFSQQSFDIIMEVRANLLSNYDESVLWFTFYADMLIIIKIILYYNLDEGLYVIPTVCLQKLCKLGLHIINGQKDHIQLYETFDFESAPILEDLRVFLNWKEHILCNDLLPLTDSFRSLNSKKGDTKPENDILPTLSKAT